MGDAQAAAELVAFIARGIVANPDAVEVKLATGRKQLELLTDDRDRGRVIGRQGRVAKALRAVLMASRTGRDMRLDIID